jgi:tRNA modification GTPase
MPETDQATRCGFVALIGAPNAGKSTLLNRLARREAAIVSPIPGTTRDLIEVHLDLKGYPVTLTDTAGIRENSEDPIELEGMKRARGAIGGSQLVLWVEDASTLDALAVGKAQHEPFPEHTMRWFVVNKTDLVGAEDIPKLKGVLQDTGDAHFVSAITDAGIDDLVESLARFAEQYLGVEPALVTRERQHLILREFWTALQVGLQRAMHGEGEELVAEELRHAATALGRVTGRVDVEDVLGRIFSEFCIGK